MLSRAPWPRAWFVFAVLLFLPSTAFCWVETAVRSHEARVSVQPDGRAEVRHQLVLKIRGGPMRVLDIGGMGTDIDPLPDATVRRALEGSASLWPLIPSAQEDGSLSLKVGAPRGLRGGSYLFEFGYTMDLNAAKLISVQDRGVLVDWIGPRLSSGVDSAKVTFVVPRGHAPPRLDESAEGAAANLLLGEIRRGAGFDEVDLVRAHLATGEPAVWRIVVGKDAFFPSVFEDEHPAPLSTPPPASASLPGATTFGFSYREWGIALCLGLLFGVLLLFKTRTVVTLAKLTDARHKPLIAAPSGLRAILGGLGIAGATLLALSHQPAWAVACASLFAALATFLLPVRVVRPRGPGRWGPLLPEADPLVKLPGAIWETRSLRGFLLFTTLSVAALVSAYRLLPLSNYLSLMSLGLVAPLLPLFWTGQRRDFPEQPLLQAQPWIKYLKKALDPEVCGLELWGRRPVLESVEASSCDEVRVRLLPLHAPAGLRALEVSFEEAAGAHVLPCVVVRVTADTPALLCLPRDIPWRRGRTAEERVALLRPAAPTRGQLLRLVRSLLSTLRAPRRSTQRSVRRSLGKDELASNAGTSLASAAT